MVLCIFIVLKCKRKKNFYCLYCIIEFLIVYIFCDDFFKLLYIVIYCGNKVYINFFLMVDKLMFCELLSDVNVYMFLI